MSEFKDIDVAVEFCIKSLAANQTATLHLVKEAGTPEDGYLEFAFSMESDKVELWNSVGRDVMIGSDYVEVSYSEIKHIVSDLGYLAAVSLLAHPQSDIIFDTTSTAYKKVNELSFILIGKKSVNLIFHSTDWDSISEYYAKYMKPTRH
jgi:hypothetical protein